MITHTEPGEVNSLGEYCVFLFAHTIGALLGAHYWLGTHNCVYAAFKAELESAWAQVDTLQVFTIGSPSGSAFTPHRLPYSLCAPYRAHLSPTFWS